MVVPLASSPEIVKRTSIGMPAGSTCPGLGIVIVTAGEVSTGGLHPVSAAPQSSVAAPKNSDLSTD